MTRATKLQPKLFSAGVVVVMVVVCWEGCVPANLSSEWARTQSCFCFWGLLSRGCTIPHVHSFPPALLLFFFLFISPLFGAHSFPLKHCGWFVWFTDHSVWTWLWGCERERESVCAVCMCASPCSKVVCVHAHTYARETLMVFHVVKGLKKNLTKKKQ